MNSSFRLFWERNGKIISIILNGRITSAGYQQGNYNISGILFTSKSHYTTRSRSSENQQQITLLLRWKFNAPLV
jgi:hypothetical protein